MSFFRDLLSLVTEDGKVLDLYMRILLAIDLEIVDREIVHTKEVCGPFMSLVCTVCGVCGVYCV